VTVADDLGESLALLQAERDENVERKDLLPTEAVAVGARLEALDPQPIGRPKKEGKLPSFQGKTRDKVAPAVGMSGRTYEKAKAVVEAAQSDPERFGHLPSIMDAKGKVDSAYREVRKAQTPPVVIPEGRCSGVNFAILAASSCTSAPRLVRSTASLTCPGTLAPLRPYSAFPYALRAPGGPLLRGLPGWPPHAARAFPRYPPTGFAVGSTRPIIRYTV
jgi:hypothetical protein